MPLTLDSYQLQNVDITLNTGTVLAKTSVTMKRNPVYAPHTGGALVGNQVFMREDPPDIMVEFFNTADLHFGQLIPNTGLSAFDIKSTETGTPSILQSDFFTKFPVDGMVIGEVETGYDPDAPSKCKVPIKCNVLNRIEPA